MKKPVALFLWAAALLIASPVKVESGLLQGVESGKLTVYKGVPFAAPPLGNLRWKGPQPAAHWDGVRQATAFAPGCVQNSNDVPNVSEDCLYLNVWTPTASSKERLPVLVWIYGGGFAGGATSIPVYDGEKLASRGVVVVSVAYRVGVFGFFAHPDLSAESKQRVSGNYGLLDMIGALQWIRKNIGAFGGDAGRVTIFGESAGGIAVSMLSASPLAKGLFHGAISQSGGSFGPFSKNPVPGENMRVLADAEAAGVEFAKTAGAGTLPELRALSTEKIAAAARQQRGMAWPIVDGWVMPDDQHRLYEARLFNDTPVLVGYNSDEGASFSRERTPEEFNANVRKRYGPFAERLLAAYPVSGLGAAGFGGPIPKSARDLARDAAFGWHTWTWARLQSRLGKGKAYLYYFDQHPEYPADSPQAGRGSGHGAEIPFVFGNFEGMSRPMTDVDRRISDAMVTYWTNFAKRGDPNGDGVPAWPAFTEANPAVQYLSGTAHPGPVPSESAMKLLDEYFSWRRGPEGAVVKGPEKRRR